MVIQTEVKICTEMKKMKDLLFKNRDIRTEQNFFNSVTETQEMM